MRTRGLGSRKSSGSSSVETAMTGVEAVSNGVPMFREPSTVGAGSEQNAATLQPARA